MLTCAPSPPLHSNEISTTVIVVTGPESLFWNEKVPGVLKTYENVETFTP